MDLTSATTQLDEEWELETGFFGCLRRGEFHSERAEEVIRILRTIASDLGESQTINRKLVSLTWSIPLFMTWQRVRVLEQGGDLVALDHFNNTIEGLLYQVLGTP